ncbi:MAG TPA: Gfo/Idh/MocA family oxidoreductase [Longimicrobiales bacterium]
MRRDEKLPDLRIGLIGYGAAGAFFHAPLIAATPGLQLAAIVTADPVRSRSASAAHPQARVLAASDALFAEADHLDLVVIASPNRTHAPLAERALALELPVVIDKPIAATAAAAVRLVEAARTADLMLTVFHNRRWDGDFLTVQRLVREQRLGTVRRFESRFERWRPVPKPGWRQDADPEAAGGVLYDLGSHLIDQALLLFGRVTHVYAELDCRGPAVTVEDDAFVALTHASGIRSHLWMSSVAPHGGPRFRVLGSRAAFTKHGLDVQESALRSGILPDSEDWGEESRAHWGSLGAGDELETVRTERGAYPAFYEGVVRSLREGEPPPVDPADAVATVRIIEAARRSAAEYRVVTVEPQH